MNPNALQPYTANRRFWQYQQEPVRLLGGSVEDNLFQIPGLEEHLDLLQSVGGNYVRCTMSSRDPGDVWPFAQDAQTGLYDLEQPNPEYWGRFQRFLEGTLKRDICIQIEVWDRFDFSRTTWLENPFNPQNNTNYTYEASGFAPDYPEHPNQNQQPFFYTVPACENNELVLGHQQRFVEWMLERTLQYPHVLYCMDNETSGSPEWGAYWAKVIKARAKHMGVTAFVTEMWDQWDVTGPMHDATFGRPELYDFVDISQDNQVSGEPHWTNMQTRWVQLAAQPRPMNMVKIYGADGNKFGHSDDDGVARFWRGLLGGMASLRFHRPDSGLGLSEKAQAILRSARMLLAEWDWLESTPDSTFQRLSERQTDGAYLSFIPGKQYVMYFPRRGTAQLDLRDAPGSFNLKWLDILASEWHAGAAVPGGGWLSLAPPGEGHWAVFLSLL
jgi:hypothetical protein